MPERVKIAIDAMSGEDAPKKIIEGIKISLKSNNENFFYLYGKQDLLTNEISKDKILERSCKIINADEIILDRESPLTAAKRGKNSSMWKSIESLKNNEAHISLSAGNTGAMLVISRLVLNTIEGINKPALAGLWPNKNSMNVVLDLGANIECNEKNLVDFACMGSALYKSLFDSNIPKVALLNVGLEETKGHDELKKTFSILKENKIKNFDFSGYIEGNQIMDGNVDVIVTDGFTGNIALKTAEGTANFITKNLKKSLNKLSMLLSYRSLNKFKEKLDPRKYNGAIFLGLQNPVVKSHGSTDAVGFAHSINVCNRIVKANLIEKIKSNLITVDAK
tara:strand:+ start:4643 stop:5650 length:1008 start_codon:yes stop_codon:yes gene_type:complete